MIHLLDQETINQIAAGEVVERPQAVCKELVENAIDAGATAITVEIKDGGLSFIRVTDNGRGIEKDEIKKAFLRHATSKLEKADDLFRISSLGFRGEALASIAAVAEVEMITKARGEMTGVRYEIQGGVETAYEEIGCPDGTTILCRNLFYNTPARRKFLKTPMTEGSYIYEMMNRLAMSKPQIAFSFIMNGQTKLSTSGNNRLKDVIYRAYGRDITSNLIEIHCEDSHMKMDGYIGKPFIYKGNRNFENYFVNGRYMKNSVITRAIEEAYRTFIMIHKFPFTALTFELEPSLLDINVHPTKMEMRYGENEELYHFIYKGIREALLNKELIPDVTPDTKKEEKEKAKEEKKQLMPHVEPFEVKRRAEAEPPEPVEVTREVNAPELVGVQEASAVSEKINAQEMSDSVKESATAYGVKTEPEQMQLFEADRLLSEAARPRHRIIGQLFRTYWLIEYERQLFIMDQHAAHEKVMYERLMKKLHASEIYSQQLMPPDVVTLSPVEADAFARNEALFSKMGFTAESFGGNEYVLRAVPEDIFGIPAKEVFAGLLASVCEEGNRINEDIFVSKLSTMACKAAVKGNMTLDMKEVDALITELLTLENPYNCPHGRPTIIRMSEAELEKKFKRIQD